MLTPASQIEEKIFVIKLFPGLNPTIFDYLQEKMKGVVIESFGTGGVTSEILDIAFKVHELTEAGVAVVVTTQCLLEGVNLQLYKISRSLPLNKIIYGKDMNTEALVPKLMWALGKTVDHAEVKLLMESPVQNDISENSEQICFS